jgi:hypothetical protein
MSVVFVFLSRHLLVEARTRKAINVTDNEPHLIDAPFVFLLAFAGGGYYALHCKVAASLLG